MNDKEKIDELLKQLKHEHDLYKKHLKVYEDENKKLRECVEFYAVNGLSKVSVGTKIDMKLMHEFYLSGGFARQVLKELNDTYKVIN